MLETLLEYLKTNPVIPTVASGGVVVWLFANLKSILFFLRDTIVSLISFVVYNNYEDARGCGQDLYDRQVAFDAIVSSSKAIWERTTNLDLSGGSQQNEATEDDYAGMPPPGTSIQEKSIQSQSNVKTYGFSIRILFGKLVMVVRSINKNQKITVDTSIRVFFGRKRKFLEKFNAEIENRVEKMRSARAGGDIVNVYYGSRMWYAFTKKYKRGMDSIFLDNDEHVELLDDIRKFLSNRELYQKMNYPYKYSALIHGVPGSGKTSTILAIASELKRDVEYVNLSTVSAVDLLDRMNGHPGRIFVFEDIDAIGFSANSTREEESKDAPDDEDDDKWEMTEKDAPGTLNLSDLLNITDGLLSSDGTICIFTTNHKDRLDPAFMRAGRMNKTIEFRYMSPKTSAKMVKHHLGIEMDGFRDGIKPAELQEMILDIKAGKKTLDDMKKEFFKVSVDNISGI